MTRTAEGQRCFRFVEHPTALLWSFSKNEYDFDSHISFIDEMTLPRMSPQLTFAYWRVSKLERYRIIEFTTQGSEVIIQIRLRRA